MATIEVRHVMGHLLATIEAESIAHCNFSSTNLAGADFRGARLSFQRSSAAVNAADCSVVRVDREQPDMKRAAQQETQILDRDESRIVFNNIFRSG
jgi:uncharacterized protein YjbI with pentapeptide repeats